MEWLANHLGHEVDMHRSFYRLHDSTIEMAKIGKLLLAMDGGQESTFAGRKLSEITLNGIVEAKWFFYRHELQFCGSAGDPPRISMHCWIADFVLVMIIYILCCLHAT